MTGLGRRVMTTAVGQLYRSRTVKEAIKGGLMAMSSRAPLGTNVYEREWDLLVVLDTCRVDAMREVAPEYNFIDDVESTVSVGSATTEWVANTFTNEYREEIENTACITANGTTEWTLQGDNTQLENETMGDWLAAWDMVSVDAFEYLDSVWEYGPRDPYGGLVVPDAITDRTIAVARESAAERIVAHYMPPHAPYRSGAVHSNRPIHDHEADPWGALRDGVDREAVWNAYLDELRWALDNVAVLLDNVDADEVVITADHGDSFGELGVYSHPIGVPHPCLRRVPWVETSATDSGQYEPMLTPPDADTDRTVQNQLKKLGYL